MKKKILAAVMAATMVFSLVACGSSDAGSSAATGSANAATGSANAGTESASAGTTSSSSSGDMIKVGIINNDRSVHFAGSQGCISGLVYAVGDQIHVIRADTVLLQHLQYGKSHSAGSNSRHLKADSTGIPLSSPHQ